MKQELKNERWRGEVSAKLDGLRELCEEKFDNNEKEHERTNEHLKNLNGQTAKNSEFRIKSKVYLGISGVLVPIILTFILNKFL